MFPQIHNGARVSQDLTNYWDRVWTHNANIEIRNVNYSDEGHYTLRDQRSRIVSVTRMDITGRSHSEDLEPSDDWRGGHRFTLMQALSLTADHHDYSGGNPLLGLLLLLGIPAGICCCCRKKIFKRKATTAATLQVDRPWAWDIGRCCCPVVTYMVFIYNFLCAFHVSTSDFSCYSSHLCPRWSCWTLSSLQHPWTTRRCKNPCCWLNDTVHMIPTCIVMLVVSAVFSGAPPWSWHGV